MAESIVAHIPNSGKGHTVIEEAHEVLGKGGNANQHADLSKDGQEGLKTNLSLADNLVNGPAGQNGNVESGGNGDDAQKKRKNQIAFVFAHISKGFGKGVFLYRLFQQF